MKDERILIAVSMLVKDACWSKNNP